jgi:hypothetical protein
MSLRKLYNFLIDPDLAAALKLVKARDGVPESVQIRTALREWLARKSALKQPRRRAGKKIDT